MTEDLLNRRWLVFGGGITPTVHRTYELAHARTSSYCQLHPNTEVFIYELFSVAKAEQPPLPKAEWRLIQYE